MSNFVKLNINDNHLSLGNFVRIIKEESTNKNIALQSDIFCSIFNLEAISDTTVNNYCIGIRAINSKYKQIYIELKEKYLKNKEIFKPIIINLLSIIDGKIYFDDDISFNSLNSVLNNNKRMSKICSKLYNFSKNDISIDKKFSHELNMLLENKLIYEFIVQILFFIILEKKQPIKQNNEYNNTIESEINSTNISLQETKNIISLQLNQSIWSIRGIRQLAEQENAYACFEMGSLEFYGLIAGYPRYVKSYNYYKIAHEKGHPTATWALGYLLYTGKVGAKTNEDYLQAWKYFKLAEKNNSSSSLNSIGRCYLDGIIPGIEKDKNKAIKYFNKAIKLGNVYALNNMGLIYEKEKNYKKAFEYFKKSANLLESWAANKVGEYYRKGIGIKKDMKKAYEYYILSSNASIYEICYWSKYNLATYFYKNGNVEAGIEKDQELAEKLLNECKEHGIK